MDGNFDNTLDLRLPRADTLIWFDAPASRCIWRALSRVARTYGRVRPDMGDGCPERFDLDFLHYIATFNRVRRPRIAARISEHGAHLSPVMIRRDRDARAFLDQIPPTLH